MLAVVVVSGCWLAWSTIALRGWRDPNRHAPVSESATLRATVADLRAEGVLLSPAVRRSLNAVVDQWLRRDDLRRQFSTKANLPDVPRLLTWVDGHADPSTIGLLDDAGSFAELAGRLGVLPADGDPVPAIIWGLRNRPRGLEPSDDVAFRLATIWRERPDVQAAFTRDGRLDLRGFLFWVVDLSPEDRSYAQLIDLHRAIEMYLAELGWR